MLRNRSLAALVVAELISTTGSQMTFVALPWFVLVTTGSVAKMSYVLAAEVAPMALFGIPSGALVGRLGARRTMLLADALRAPLIALVPLLHGTGHLSFPLLLCVVFVLGVFMSPYFAAQRTIVPELFGDDEAVVSKASALIGGASHVTIVLGPVIAGTLIAWIGAPSVLLVDAGTYVAAFAIVLAFVSAGARLPADEESRGLLAGVRYLARDSLLGPLTLTVILVDAFTGALLLTMPALAYVRYDRDPHVAGWLFAILGAGTIAGSLLAMRLLDRLRPLRLAAFGIVAAAVPLWLLVIRMPWWGVALALAACGVFLPLVNAPGLGLITTRPPAALRAKVLTAVVTASALGGPAGRVAIGPLFDSVGISATYAILAGGMTAGAVAFASVALAHDRREGREAARLDSAAWQSAASGS